MRCWCGRRHPKGDARNGEVKHWAVNWKLHQLRNGQEKGADGKKD